MFVYLFSSRMEMLKFPQPSGADFSTIKDLCLLRAPVCHTRPWGWCHRNSPFWSLTCNKLISLLFSKCVCVCSVSCVWLFETFGFPGSSDGKVPAAMWETWVDPWATVHGIAKSWTWLSNFTGSLDCSPPGSSVRGISQPRILEWVAVSYARGSSWPGDRIWVSCIGRQILYHWAT